MSTARKTHMHGGSQTLRGESTTIGTSTIATLTLDDSGNLSSSATAGTTYMTKDSIRAFLVDFHQDATSLFDRPRACWEAFYERHHHPNYTHVRNTGNVLTSQQFIEIMTSGTLQGKAVELVSIDNIVLLAEGRTAVVTYTVDQYFSYKGVDNSDRCVYTLVLEQGPDGQPLMVQEQRSNGMPIPKPQTRWQANADTQGKHNPIVDYKYEQHDAESRPSVGACMANNSSRSNHSSPPKKPTISREI